MKTAITRLLVAFLLMPFPALDGAGSFAGKFFRGEGDTAYLQLLDTARRLFDPDPAFQNLPMLYTPAWNGLVEGPTWGAWWIQNSYGPTYCALPFYTEPLITFLENANECWFKHIGDGKRVWEWHGHNHGPVPDGQLCDCANNEMVIHKQGDGRVAIHDWGLEFTAAGLLMQAELLLIGREEAAIRHDLPLLERNADFIETRREPATNLFLAGPAANLLAPSYAGWKKPDGTYGRAYLAGLSITYIAALDRLIEVEKLAGRTDAAKRYAHRRDLARKGLPRIQTDEGYFVKSMDPDGTRHGVFGAAKHGYFEASPNHDAICFRVVDETTAERIYKKIAAIPGLRPYDFIIANYPSLDDLYTKPQGLWGFGTWVNGGHWSTCEARMMMGYLRLGKFADARRSMERILTFARRFRMDNPLVKFGSAVYQPHEPINLCYDSFGPPAAFIRGLFEYLYRADGLTLLPHVPPGITYLEQRFPIRFGRRKLYLAVAGTGAITRVLVNGRPCQSFEERSVFLPYESLPERAAVCILRGDAQPRRFLPPKVSHELSAPPPPDSNALMASRLSVISVNKLPLRLGADSNGGSRYRGEIDDVRLFKRALTADEVTQLARREETELRRDPALVLAYTFEETKNDAFPNVAGNGLAATIVENVERTTGGPGGTAIKLNGTGYVEVAPDPRLDLTTECTMAAWVKPEKLATGGGRIIDKTGVGTSNGYLLDTYPSNSLRAIVESDTLDHNAQLTPGTWTHVAATINRHSGISLYVNGTAVAAKKKAAPTQWVALVKRTARLRAFHARLVANELGDSYEAAHTRLAINYLTVAYERGRLRKRAHSRHSLHPPGPQRTGVI